MHYETAAREWLNVVATSVHRAPATDRIIVFWMPQKDALAGTVSHKLNRSCGTMIVTAQMSIVLQQ